jgi:hypothetical protein
MNTFLWGTPVRISNMGAAIGLALVSTFSTAQSSLAPTVASPFTSPQTASGAGGEVRSMHLAPVGETGGCQTAVRVLKMHYTSMACTQSAADFGAKWLNNYHLKSKCPVGQPMKGVYGIDCVNAPTAGFVSGSVFSATVCCGVPQRPHAAIEFHSDHGHGHGHNHTAHGAGIRLREVPLRMETTAQGELCPELGAVFRRHEFTAPYQHWRGHARTLDTSCNKRGARAGFASVRFDSCWHQPNPRVQRQTQYFVSADVICGR